MSGNNKCHTKINMANNIPGRTIIRIPISIKISLIKVIRTKGTI